MPSIRDLPDRRQGHKIIPLLKSSENSVTSEKSTKLHQSTNISTKEHAEKNCEEKYESRSRSQNDYVCVCATSKEHGASIPKKQHTYNTQEDKNIIQFFSEDTDENFGCIPGKYVHMRIAGKLNYI